jgi:hypothetical protein
MTMKVVTGDSAYGRQMEETLAGLSEVLDGLAFSFAMSALVNALAVGIAHTKDPERALATTHAALDATVRIHSGESPEELQ